jgi:MoaD family protein
VTAGQGPNDSRLVAVKLFGSIKDVFREKDIKVPAAAAPDIQRLLDLICTSSERKRAIFQDAFVLREDVVVLLNGRNIAFLDRLQTGLREGDEVRIFPPTYGG